MSQTPAVAHLRRAYGLITGVEDRLGEFRQQVLQHEASAEQDQPFVAGMISAFKGARQLAAEKASLRADLDLAIREIDKAEASDPEAKIEARDGFLQAKHLRAAALVDYGLIEMLHGSSEMAKQFFRQSLDVFESSTAHYFMALAYEGDYDAPNALAHYERCLELDPDGEYSVAALRSAEQMRNYKKKFRGSWGTFGCLLVVFFPAAIIYYLVKRK